MFIFSKDKRLGLGKQGGKKNTEIYVKQSYVYDKCFQICGKENWYIKHLWLV